MLHQDMMFRFNREGDLRVETAIPTPPAVTPQPASHSRLILILRVAGNTLAGAVFLGSLVLAPLWLERLLNLI